MNDASVSPHHAEVVATRQGWVVRDLGSMYGTYLNGSAVTGRQQFLNENDELRFGRLVLEVKFVPRPTSPPGQEAAAQRVAPPVDAPPVDAPPVDAPPIEPSTKSDAVPAIATVPRGMKTTTSFLRVQAAMQQTWEQAINSVTSAGARPWQDKHMRALLRASYSVCQIASPEELLQSILDDAV